MNTLRITRLWSMPPTPDHIHAAWFLLEVTINEAHITKAQEKHPRDFWDVPTAELHIAAAEDVYDALERAGHFEALAYWKAKGYPVFFFPVDCCEIIPMED
ncbi:MAG: hypothetical protein ACEQSB_01275 [Undibacterium sp.]